MQLKFFNSSILCLLLSCCHLSAEELSLSNARSSEASIQQTIESLRAFVKEENETVRSGPHASRIRLQLNSRSEIRLDRPVVILAHGLLDSPINLEQVERLAFASGAHVFNIRLPGHFEKDFRHLDSITGDEWLSRMEEIHDWARRLSSEITLGGHSTGGLVAATVAARHPETVSKLLLFSPAFGISSAVTGAINTFTYFRLSGWVVGRPRGDSRYFSSYAGRTLANLILSLEGPGEFSNTIQALQNTRVLWFDTPLDQVIDLQKNARIAARLRAANPQAVHYLLDAKTLTLHQQSACLKYLARHVQIPLIENFFGQ